MLEPRAQSKNSRWSARAGLAACLLFVAACADEEPEIHWCEMPPEAACWPGVRDCAAKDEVCVRDPETDDPICAPKCFGDFECHAGFECVDLKVAGACWTGDSTYVCLPVEGMDTD